MSSIYNSHITYIKSNDEFYNVIDSIIGDMFMGRVKIINNKFNLYVFASKHVLKI
jgi:hypothetical protein